MNPYVVLARKWRPYRFADLIGQEHAVRTLQNGLISGRIPHAFVFMGIRGVGKTTLARLLAMALNCQQAPTADPCGICDSCTAIIAGNQPDVLEIDAASRTKAEQMREVLDTVRYQPVASRFKVYIVDEVHMLSMHAFNALLKTLEEPPPNVKFIFATTEARKIPATILSRCQRYDLKRVSRAILEGHLAAILQQEGIGSDPEALEAVAKAADGSVRDALSLLDQAIAHGNGAVHYATVRELLGLTDKEAVLSLLEQVVQGDGAAVLAAMQQFHEGGIEPTALVNELLTGLHEAACRQALGEKPLPGLPQQDALSQEQLQMLYQVLLRGLADIRQAELPRQALEMLLLRAVYLKPVPAIDKLIRALKNAPPGAATPATGASAPTSAPPQTTGFSAAKPVTVADLPREFIGKSHAAPGKREGENRFLPRSSEPQQEYLPSWQELVYIAMQHNSALALKLGQQVCCVGYTPATAERPLSLVLRLTNNCFGPPEKLAQRMKEFLESIGNPGARVLVQPASDEARPETLHEGASRKRSAAQVALEQSVLDNPAVAKLTQRFGAEILAVEPVEELDG